ncbi:MAG: [NiFe]-hydrogenase assembly chaperone HybE [Rhodocyclaceae bacterium]|nr:[NiFe]-hydrogenase assembly chaperone HybE [Rhodocyclaceae bacterium]
MSLIVQRENPAPIIEAVFRRIHEERMAGLPFLNPALEVAAVGFTRHEEDWRGILLTPWVMALVLLPASEAWPLPAFHQRVFRHYAAGTFAFLPNEEEGLGIYLTCPLISDLRPFSDHATALMTARECLALLDRPATEISEMRSESISLSRRRFLLRSAVDA